MEGCRATAVARRGKERVVRSVPVAASQIFKVSQLAERIQVPSGLTAHAVTRRVWPVRVVRSVPVAASQIFKVWSQLAETIQVPSGLTAHAFTWPVWPVKVARSVVTLGYLCVTSSSRAKPPPIVTSTPYTELHLSLIHISEPTRLGMISYAVFCL